MKFRYTFLAVLILSCTNSTDNQASMDKNVPDTVNEEIELMTIRKEYISLYQRPLVVDTTFISADTTFHLHFRHYSKMDSELIIPAKYNFDSHKDFSTHEFESQVYITKNEDTILSKIIVKQDFNKELTQELALYGTLLYPILHINTDTLKLSYSLSIPVTDVGKSVSIEFDKRGRIYKIE